MPVAFRVFKWPRQQALKQAIELRSINILKPAHPISMQSVMSPASCPPMEIIGATSLYKTPTTKLERSQRHCRANPRPMKPSHGSGQIRAALNCKWLGTAGTPRRYRLLKAHNHPRWRLFVLMRRITCVQLRLLTGPPITPFRGKQCQTDASLVASNLPQ